MISAPNAIEVSNLYRTYHTGNVAVHALRGVNFEIQTGKFVAVKGRSGSGKTTLLNCIGGLDQPTQGNVVIYGQNIFNMNERERTRWRREQVGFVFQSFGLLPTLSAYENVELILRMSSVGFKDSRQMAFDALEKVGLGKWINHRPSEMSGGQQQRVAIARAIINSPKLILADEPTAELDSGTAREILSLFKEISRNEGITVLMVSHDGLVDEYVEQILTLKSGLLTADGSQL
jgi:putative ABC transport system ATP-binding protein